MLFTAVGSLCDITDMYMYMYMYMYMWLPCGHVWSLPCGPGRIAIDYCPVTTASQPCIIEQPIPSPAQSLWEAWWKCTANTHTREREREREREPNAIHAMHRCLRWPLAQSRGRQLGTRSRARAHPRVRSALTAVRAARQLGSPRAEKMDSSLAQDCRAYR